MHVKKIDEILTKLDTTINQLFRNDESKYTKQICALGKMVKAKLQNVLIVLKKHKNDGALRLGWALNKACDVTKVFTSITERIQLLKVVAQKENNTQMVANLNNLLKALQEIDAIWKKKDADCLYKGLSHRLNQK